MGEEQLREEERKMAKKAGIDLSDDEDEVDDDKEQNSDEDEENRVREVKVKERNHRRDRALAIGGTAAVVAVGVMSFGDVQATLDNIPILGGGGDIEMDIDACCEDCDACDCDA